MVWCMGNQKRAGTVRIVLGVLAGLYVVIGLIRLPFVFGEEETATVFGALSGIVIFGIAGTLLLVSGFTARKKSQSPSSDTPSSTGV